MSVLLENETALEGIGLILDWGVLEYAQCGRRPWAGWHSTVDGLPGLGEWVGDGTSDVEKAGAQWKKILQPIVHLEEQRPIAQPKRQFIGIGQIRVPRGAFPTAHRREINSILYSICPVQEFLGRLSIQFV